MRLTSSLLPALAAMLVLACSIETDDLFGDPGGGSEGGNGSGGDPSTGGRGEGGRAVGPGGSTNDGGSPSNGGSPNVGGSTSTGNMCGDGVKGGVEECDGDDFGGLDCTDFGSNAAPGLDCSGTCKIDASGCTGPSVCGNGALESGEQCDDGNLDGFDGCSPTCQIDGTCAAPIEVAVPLGTTTIKGDTTNGGSTLSSQSGACQGSAGPELVLRIVPQASGIFTAYLPSDKTSFDAVLYASQQCPPPNDARCHDNYGTPGDNGGEVLSFGVTMGMPFHLVIDGYQVGELGEFELSLDISSGDTCADPVPIVVEGSADIDLFGRTNGLVNNASSNGLCGFAGAGPDIVYQVLALAADDYDADLTPLTNFNTVLHARTTCDSQDSQIACSSPALQDSSSISYDQAANQTIYIWVDGTSNNAGSYNLEISH